MASDERAAALAGDLVARGWNPPITPALGARYLIDGIRGERDAEVLSLLDDEIETARMAYEASGNTHHQSYIYALSTFRNLIEEGSPSSPRPLSVAAIATHIEQMMRRAEDTAGLSYPDEEHYISAEELLAWLEQKPDGS